MHNKVFGLAHFDLNTRKFTGQGADDELGTERVDVHPRSPLG